MFCKRCGRKLSNPISIERGYGSTCFAKQSEDNKKSKTLSDDTKVEEQNFVDELKEKVS